MSFMLSKQAYVSDTDTHWRPHLMFFVGNSAPDAWGANVHGSLVLAQSGDPEPVTTFFVPVAKWSDGSTDAMTMK